MGWADESMGCFDLETTGVSVENDRVVTGCFALIPEARFGADGPLPRPPQLFQWMADPGIEIPEGASKIHGITTEMARTKGLPAAHVIEDITSMLAWCLREGIPVAGANLQYDLTLLDRECRRNGLRPLVERMAGEVAPIIDVMVIDKAADPYRGGGRKLTDLAPHYRVKLEGAHDSTADALAAGRIAWRMAQGPIPRTPRRDRVTGQPIPPRPNDPPELDIGGMKLADLHTLQVEWKAEQAKSLAAHFKREGKDYSTVRPEWPFIPVPEPEPDKLF